MVRGIVLKISVVPGMTQEHVETKGFVVHEGLGRRSIGADGGARQHQGDRDYAFPARKMGNAYDSISSTFLLIKAGSSFVPERYGPAIKIIIDLRESAVTEPSPELSHFLSPDSTQYT